MNHSPSAVGAPPQERPVLLIFDTGHASCTAMLRGIIHYQRQHQTWTAFLDDAARPDRELALLQSGRWHGVISAHVTPALAAACAGMKLPLVDLLDGAPQAGALKIRPDNVAIGHMGAEHLLERRFSHFGFSGFKGLTWSSERRDGFLESLELVGLPCQVHEIEYPGESPVWDSWQIALLASWLRQLPTGSAVMACNDIRALQVVRAAGTAGLRVPEDVAVLGVNNDTGWCELATPAISSVAPNFFEAGLRAAEQMDGLLNGRKPAVMDVRIEPAGLVARQSTDVLALRDKKVATALDFIREHACHGITVEQVVEQVHASRSQMESRFRRYLGRSPQAEIRRVQVEKIRHLLATTDLSLKEIADQAGFVHVEYMCVLFKRLTGETMGQYRRNVSAQEQVRAPA